MSAEKFAIDFDGSVTNIYKLGSGIVLSEPTVAAVGIDGKDEIKAVGNDARKLIGKTAEKTKIVFPIFEGEVVNERVAAGLLSVFLKKVGVKNRLVNVRSVISVPCGVTADMLYKYEAVAKSVGINKTYFVEAPILSALGQRLPLTDSCPIFLIDMAGGVTNIAALSLDGIISGISVNFGSNKITTDIIDYIADYYGLQIGLLSAEKIKAEIGSLLDDDGLSTVVNGRDIRTGTPKSICIKALDLIEPVRKYYDKIAELSMSMLVKLPPEVSAEIRHSGIYVAGVGAKIYGLEKYYAEKLKMTVNIFDVPDMAVALGGGVAIGNYDLLKKIMVKF